MRELKICRMCGVGFTVHGKYPGRTCPSCMGKTFESCICSFCGSTWVSTEGGWNACPRCSFMDDSYACPIEDVWSDSNMCIRYVVSDRGPVYYLWVDGMPS